MWVLRGSAIEMASRGDQIGMRKRTYDLANVLNRVTADNLHPEQDQGNEYR